MWFQIKVQVGFFLLILEVDYFSGVHISLDDSEEAIHIAEMNDTSYEWAACFHWDEAKTNIF